VAVGGLATRASADRATLSATAPQPWTGGAKTVTPIEAMAARIASRIAGHTVSVSCEGVPRFRSSDGTDAMGLVKTLVNKGTGRYALTATVIELTSKVCGPLQRFAQAAQKPTRCVDPQHSTLIPCFIGVKVARGSGPALCWTSACYSVGTSRPSYWSDYSGYSTALLTLAHEAIHTQQAVAGRPVPADAVIEAQADCSGMQWMRWVAEQLGDSSADGQSIASYFWIGLYPQVASIRGSRPYWSADCRPGGPLDIRAADATAWP
jgi:hypothetical protein